MISVVIPLYNKGHTIVETLASVLAQDFQDFEIVIVDDGSTDDGPDKVRRCFSDPRIRLIHQEHQGVSAARNTGVRAGIHDLIAFLDADDILQKSYLSTMKSVTEEFPDAKLYSSGGIISYPDGSGYLRQSKRIRQTGRVNFFSNPGFFVNSSSMLLSKRAFEQIGGFPTELTVNEDYVLQYKLALSGEVVFCPRVMSVYRKGVEGQVSARGLPFHPDVVKRMNSVHEYWATLDPHARNQDYVKFAVFDLQLNLLDALRRRDYTSIDHLLNEVDRRLVRRLGSARITSIRTPRLRALAMARIHVLRVARRLSCYPRLKHVKNVRSIPAVGSAQ